ncbi:MAG: hypothetical protein RL885_24140, partial [Planctomycetota bacterium]
MQVDWEREAAEFRSKVDQLKTEIQKVIVGHIEVIDQVLLCLLARGHLLLDVSDDDLLDLGLELIDLGPKLGCF